MWLGLPDQEWRECTDGRTDDHHYHDRHTDNPVSAADLTTDQGPEEAADPHSSVGFVSQRGIDEVPNETAEHQPDEDTHYDAGTRAGSCCAMRSDFVLARGFVVCWHDEGAICVGPAFGMQHIPIEHYRSQRSPVRALTR